MLTPVWTLTLKPACKMDENATTPESIGSNKNSAVKPAFIMVALLTAAYGRENANPFAAVEKDARIFFHTIDKNEFDLVFWDTQLTKQSG
jgi:hypothetical protein